MRTYPQIKESLILEYGVRYSKKFAINGSAGITFPALNQAVNTRADSVYTFTAPDDVEIYGITLVNSMPITVTFNETNEYPVNQSYHISAENTRLGKWLDDFHFASNINGVSGANNGYLVGANPFAPGNELFNPYASVGPVFFPGAAQGPKFDITPTAQNRWSALRVLEENYPFVNGRQGIILSEKEVMKVTFSSIKWPNGLSAGLIAARSYEAYFYGRVLK